VKRLPKLCVHRALDQFYVRINGRVHYCGTIHGPGAEERAEASRQRLLAEVRQGVAVPASKFTVNDLVDSFRLHAEVHYRHPDGSGTGEMDSLRQALRPLVRAYGESLACEFGPLQLKALRELFVSGEWRTAEERAACTRAMGWSRKHANHQVNRVRHVFRWGVSEGLVPPEVLVALRSVQPLQLGRTHARETLPVVPAPEPAIAAVCERVGPILRAMVELQLLTGMRPGELVRLRPREIDRTGKLLSQLLRVMVPLVGVWAYLPGIECDEAGQVVRQTQHKTAHHGHTRVVPIGPRAQQILAPLLLGRSPDAFVFSPAESLALLSEQRRASRSTPRTPSQESRGSDSRSRPPGECYTTAAYAKAIAAACKGRPARAARRGCGASPGRPGVAHWHPHQLRHNAATRLAAEFGEDVARAVCGHSSLDVTRRYVAQDLGPAFEAIGKVG
jgi:integrase